MKSLAKSPGALWRAPTRCTCRLQVCRWLSTSPGPQARVGPVFRKYALSDIYDTKRIRSDLEDGGPHGAEAVRRDGPRRVTLGPKRRYKLLQALAEARFHKVVGGMGSWRTDHEQWEAFGIFSQAALDREARLFRANIARAFDLAQEKGFVKRSNNPLFWSIYNAFIRADVKGLSTEIKYAFQSFIMRSKFSKAITATHEQLADLRFPYEWFPATRALQRTVHLHVGPTNSGKTYHALKALESAKTGLYAGPLRLLAHEVYSRFQAKGRRVALVTGEEMRIPEGDESYFAACTVEMTPLNKRVDVAVIDEIQMIADIDRGWAWTQAFLGIQAKELHLCGEERAVDLIRSLCARIGDKCVVHTYKRLTSLQPMKESLGGRFERLRKGDAVVAFSRVALHSLKAGIEEATGRRCAIVYGSLPPETRAQQAALFNDPDNDYDFLVASDAIGMGLNLEIKRVVFETAFKHDGILFRNLTVPEMKQIGGRAGRYRTAAQEINKTATEPQTEGAPPEAPSGSKWGAAGYVTTMEDVDLEHVHKSFTTEVEPLKTAGLFPPTFIIEHFSKYFPPSTPLSFILLRLRELTRLSDRFFICDYKDAIAVADIIQPFKLSIYDRCIFLTAPVTMRDYGQVDVLRAMARCVAQMSGGHLLDIPEIDIDILDATKEDFPDGEGEYLRHLEALHKAITLYLWLSYRYVGIFQSQALAFHVKELVEKKITEYLEGLSYAPEARKERQQRLRRMVEKARQTQESVLADAPPEDLQDDSGKSVSESQPHQEGPGSWNEEGHEEPLMEDPEDAKTAPLRAVVPDDKKRLEEDQPQT